MDIATELLRQNLKLSEILVTKANEVVLTSYFRGQALRRMLMWAVVTALGIGLFAWGANPPPPQPGTVVSLEGAMLVGVDLHGANLRGVNLATANLTGADLRFADLTG